MTFASTCGKDSDGRDSSTPPYICDHCLY